MKEFVKVQDITKTLIKWVKLRFMQWITSAD